MSGDGDYQDDDIDALIEQDQQQTGTTTSPPTDNSSHSPHDALPSLEHVDDGGDEDGGGFIVEEQQSEAVSGNKRTFAQFQAAHNNTPDDDIDDLTADDFDRLITQHSQTNSPPSPPPTPPPPPHQPADPTTPATATATTAATSSSLLTCVECHALAYNVPYYKAFNLLVCNPCQSQHPHLYQLITKSTAKATYLLSDSDMSGMKHLLRPNPTKGSFANMKLYRKCDVLTVVTNRYGSEAAMEAEKQRRELERIEKDVAKRKKGRAAIEKEKRVREWRMDKEVEGKGHKHTFVDVAIKGGGKKQKCSSCGFTLEFEEL